MASAASCASGGGVAGEGDVDVANGAVEQEVAQKAADDVAVGALVEPDGAQVGEQAANGRREVIRAASVSSARTALDSSSPTAASSRGSSVISWSGLSR